MKKGDKDDDDDDAKPGPLSEQRGAEFKAEAKEDETAASSDHKLDAPARALGEDVPLEDLGEYWKGTDGLLRRATAHIYRKIIAPACEGGFREWFDDHCEIFDGSSKSSEHKPEFFVLYKEFEAKVSAALEEFVLEQFDEPVDLPQLALLDEPLLRPHVGLARLPLLVLELHRHLARVLELLRLALDRLVEGGVVALEGLELEAAARRLVGAETARRLVGAKAPRSVRRRRLGATATARRLGAAAPIARRRRRRRTRPASRRGASKRGRVDARCRDGDHRRRGRGRRRASQGRRRASSESRKGLPAAAPVAALQRALPVRPAPRRVAHRRR